MKTRENSRYISNPYVGLIKRLYSDRHVDDYRVKDIAKAMGLSPATISQIGKGKNHPKVKPFGSLPGECVYRERRIR